MMCGWCEGGERGLANGCSGDVRRQMVQRVGGGLSVVSGKIL